LKGEVSRGGSGACQHPDTNLMQKTRFLRRHCEKTLKDRDLKFLRSSSYIQKTKTLKFQVSN
jgi:hypothetical protein